MDQDRYIPGVPCWVDIAPPDPEAAAEFYGALFGWELEDVMPAGAPGHYYTARIGGGDVAAIGSPEDGAGVAAWNTYVWVSDAAETAAKVRAAGGSVVEEPVDVGDAGRTAVFADPAGASFRVWEPKRHRGATVVNEHGAVNFNDLHTRDVDEAAAFYGAVFGWDLLDIGGSFMWAMKEYGDFLEERTPGIRANMAEMGAPDRFVDVVASIATIDADDTEAAPHWGVTFAVDDADQTAARAVELGGRVLAEPADLPWVRMAVIADPQGGVFTASTFKPENR